MSTNIIKRKSYTISKSFRKYLFASIITMAVMNVNGIIDAMLMGHILGPKALSSIQTSMPVISLIAAIGLLVTNGAALLMPEAVGKRDYDSSNRLFSVSLLANLVLGAVGAVGCVWLSKTLASFLSVDKSLYDGVQNYTFVLLAGSILLLLQNDISILIDVLGNPVTVTIGMSASVGVNIVCDILYAKVFNLGIRGAALATLTGALVSVIMFVRYFIVRRGQLNLKLNLSQFFPTLLRVMVKSIPGVIGSLGTTLLTLLCNSFVQKALGADGMFTMTVGYSLVSFGSMISGGIGSAFMGIGGMLRTQEDYKGFSMLVRRGMLLSAGFGLILNVLSWLFPGQIGILFGANTDALIEMTRSALPIVSIFVLAFSIINPLSVVYQVNAFSLLATLSSLSLLASAALGLFTAQALFAPERIWFAFPIAAAIAVAFVLVAGLIKKVRLKYKTEPVTLIKKPDPNEAPRLDISVPCSEDGIRSGLAELKEFFDRFTSQKTKAYVMHALEEILINIAGYTGMHKQQFFDLLLRKEDKELYVHVKDCGPPFDPVGCVEEKWKSGLTIMHHYAKDMNYNYSFGMNMTTFKFPLDESGLENGRITSDAAKKF